MKDWGRDGGSGVQPQRLTELNLIFLRPIAVDTRPVVDRYQISLSDSVLTSSSFLSSRVPSLTIPSLYPESTECLVGS